MILFSVCLTIILINVLYLEWAVLSDLSARNVKGVFVQKNTLGQVSLLTLLFSVFVFVSNTAWVQKLSVALFAVAFWLLFLSTSMTSNLLIPTGIASALAVVVIGRYQRGWLIVIGLGVLFSVLLVINWSEFFDYIGKSTTFTGRTNHWFEYGQLIEQRMVMGHGYGAYPDSESFWLVMGAHNGYIELTYQTGVVGLSIFLMIIGLALRSWWGIVKEKKLVFDVSFLFSYMIIYLVANLVETYTMHRSGMYWPLFIYASLQLTFLNKQCQMNKKVNK